MLTARKLQRWLNAGVALQATPAPSWMTATAFFCATLIAPLHAATLAALVGAGGLLWILRALLRDGWTEAEAAVRLDRLASAGGLLLTMREVPDVRWQPAAAIAAARARRPPLHGGRPLMLIAGAIVFALLARVLPPPTRSLPPEQLAAGSSVQALDEQMAALAREQAVPSSLQDEIRRLSEEAKAGKFNGADWEAMDNVGARLEDDARRQADALARAAEAARRLEQSVAGGASAETQAREREALEKALAAVGAESKPSSGRSSKDGVDEGKSGASAGAEAVTGKGTSGRAPTSLKELKALRESMEHRGEELAKRFPGSGRPGGPSQDFAAGEGAETTQGGPGAGAAAPDPLRKTPLRYGNETKFQTERLRYAPIPKSRTSTQAGELWGLSSAPPSATPPARLSAPDGTVEGDELAPGVRQGTAPPRDRELVRRYFDPTAP